MNSKEKKLLFIRYKNKAKKVFPYPKWKLKRSKKWLCKWINTKPGLLEDNFVFVSYESQKDFKKI